VTSERRNAEGDKQTLRLIAIEEEVAATLRRGGRLARTPAAPDQWEDSMTGSSGMVQRRRKLGVDFHSSSGLYRSRRTGSPRAAATPESRMSSDSEETIEARIARWLETGEGEHSLIGDITALVELNRGRLYAKFGEDKARDVVDAGPSHIWEELKLGKFDCSRRFSPWLSVVLRNACEDERRRRKRHARSFSDMIRDDDGNKTIESLVVESCGETTVDASHIAHVVKELERLFDEENCLLFATAAGLADHLPKTVLDCWCAGIDGKAGLRSAIDELLKTPVYGRQEALSLLLDMRPATCRKRFQRASEKLAESPLLKELRNLLGGAAPPAG
jgi:DNA-directed RNA polymerase specialized sigma24 family protein